MGYMCDFWGDQRSIVYCRSDAASLCFSCDRNVHSANALSRRHSRTLVCERCNLQPAFVRCIEEKTSLCPNCDWMGHGGSSIGSMHKTQAVNCYSGCPSAAELSTIWSFFLDFFSVGDSSCNQVMGSMIPEDPRDSQNTQVKKDIQDTSVAVGASNFQNVDKSTAWSSSMLSQDMKLQNVDLSAGSTYAASSKVALAPTTTFFE
ncbi:hypothetical protein ACH5RR_029504 [Cinchona calisaya]|uniref:B box-type domain-containing protein n=1 Tax=Cinchona calisaya TaxID=153742 RepID=A0ABD2YRY9_9GENT